MKKGVQMFTVRDYMNDREQVEQTLKTIREIGYDSIQAATPEFMTHREFKGCMERFGFDTYSANADFEAMRDNPAEFAAAVEQAVMVEQDICPANPFDSLRVSFENMVKLRV